MTKRQRNNLYRIIISILITVVVLTTEKYVNNNLLKLGLFLIPYLIIGYDILYGAILGIKNKEVFDENFLMAIATIGALLIGFLKTGDYLEAIAVMVFYQVGELFQSIAVGKSRKNISNLMDIRPETANIVVDNNIITVDPEEVEAGSVIIVRPGEKIPIDGVVLKGNSSINTTSLTGESMPRDVFEGDEVISGCVNLSKTLEIKTQTTFMDSTVSKILDLVENASNRKSKSEKFISKFSKIYTPLVCIFAFCLAVIVPFSIYLINKEHVWIDWLYRSLTFLVISCPCALVISIPLTFFACIGGSSKNGILVKGSNYLETLSKTKYVIFDKTGTLTKGVFEVSEVIGNEEVLEFSALLESNSVHPIGLSIVSKYNKEIDVSRVKDAQEIAGEGIVGVVDDKRVYCGNSKLMDRYNISFEKYLGSETVIYVAINSIYSGCIVIKDNIKESSIESIINLKKIGINNIYILTGDNKKTAEEIAKKLKIDKIYSELLPNQKVQIIEDVINKKENKESVVFVGDGINDAPSLTRADVGIAMGALGSSAAIEAADIVLMDDNPDKVSKIIKISKKCMKIVYQNIIFAISIKFICLLLGALGIVNMWLAIFADVGVMVIAILNSIRALFINKI